MTQTPADRSRRHTTRRLLSGDEELVREIVNQRLDQDGIRKILNRLDSADHETFTSVLAGTLRKTSALLEVSKRVSDSLSLDILLERMVEMISEFLNSERCTIFLHDKDSGELFSRVAQGDLKEEIRFPSKLGISGSVFHSGETVVIPDAYSDSRFNPEIDKKTGFRTRNILCAPIKNNDGLIIGVVQILNRHEGQFDGSDVTLVEAMAAQASSAFINAQLHEQVARARDQEQQMLEVTNVISQELQLKPLLKRVMDTVTTILDADRSTLFLYDDRTAELWSHVAQGMGSIEIRFPAHLGLAGSCFSEAKVINIPDAYSDSRFNPAFDKKSGYRTSSILCMPIFAKSSDVLGVIQVLNKRGGPFSSLDERRLKAFSSQAAIAIENAKLFEEIINMKNYNECVLQSMSSGVLTTDATQSIVRANDAALRILNCDHEDRLIGKRISEFFSAHNSWLFDAVDEVFETGLTHSLLDVDLVLSGMTKSGRIHSCSVNASTAPLTNSKGDRIGCMIMLEDITTEKRLRGTMSRYMPPKVAAKLLEEGEDALGGHIQVASVLFSDIRRFTTISEEIGAQETVSLLNDYFSVMVDIILDHDGILDKFIGDAIMAVFGAPFVTDSDTDNAVLTGIEMLQALRILNQQRVRKNQRELEIGIGINTDEILSGNIGSSKRMDYTVIGDGVNLASRLEGANKPYGTQLLISEFTLKKLTRDFCLREVDRLRVKGKAKPVAVFEVLDHHNADSFPHRDDVLGFYNDGLKRYRDWNWAGAKRCFEQALSLHAGDTVSKLYTERCDYFLSEAPAPDWDGVWVMTSK